MEEAIWKRLLASQHDFPRLLVFVYFSKGFDTFPLFHIHSHFQVGYTIQFRLKEPEQRSLWTSEKKPINVPNESWGMPYI